MNTVYGWKSGWRPTDLNPQVVGDELTRIRDKHGIVTAHVVVEEAKRKRSPLHAAVFHVADEKAADLYYLERARKIIQAVVVVQEGSSSVRAFHFVRPSVDVSADYVAAVTVANNPYMAEQVRTGLVRKIEYLRRELVAWDEFAEIVAAMDAVLVAA